jgi:hypothetical protein
VSVRSNCGSPYRSSSEACAGIGRAGARLASFGSVDSRSRQDAPGVQVRFTWPSSLSGNIGRRVRVLRRDLDQLIADAETASRVDQPGLVEDGEEEGGATPSSSGAANSPPLVLCSIIFFMTSSLQI